MLHVWAESYQGKHILGCVNSGSRNLSLSKVVDAAPVHGHDESWGAVPALRAIVADKPGLHLVQVVGRAHALHSRDGPSVALQERSYALQKSGIDSLASLIKYSRSLLQ